MLCDRDPEHGEPLASQPTLSRFENAVRGRDLIRAGRDQEKQAIARFAAQYPEAWWVVIDLDATEDPMHGQQMFSFFNAFYDSHCFLPLLAFLSVHGPPSSTSSPPGCAPASAPRTGVSSPCFAAPWRASWPLSPAHGSSPV